MFCTECGRPGNLSDRYCGHCGRSVPSAAGSPRVAAAIDSGLRLAAATAGLAAAVCVVVAICSTYSFVGIDGQPTTLHDSGATLAYNIVFIATLLVGGLLSCFKASARLGLGIGISSGTVFPALFIGDIVTVVRSGPFGTSSYYGPGPGFYWGIGAAALGVCGAVIAASVLRRSGDLSLSATRASVWWAIVGLILSATWIVGTWLPWERQTLTATVNGASKTFRFDPCCSLSQEPGQWATQWITVTACIALACLLAACIRSAATATGIILAAATYAAAPNIDGLFHQPYTLEQVAPTLHTTEFQLQQDRAVVVLHTLPGAWIAAAAVLGMVLLAVARCIHVADNFITSPVQMADRNAPAAV